MAIDKEQTAIQQPMLDFANAVQVIKAAILRS